MILFMVSLINIPMSEANTLFFSCPALVSILAWAFLAEPLLPTAMGAPRAALHAAGRRCPACSSTCRQQAHMLQARF